MDLREYHAERIAEEARRILNDKKEGERMSRLSYTPTFHMYDEFPELVWVSIGGESVAYFRERTCHVVKSSRKYVLSDGTELFEDGCSECNGYLSDDDNYCSNCGARVEEEK